MSYHGASLSFDDLARGTESPLKRVGYTRPNHPEGLGYTSAHDPAGSNYPNGLGQWGLKKFRAFRGAVCGLARHCCWGKVGKGWAEVSPTKAGRGYQIRSHSKTGGF